MCKCLWVVLSGGWKQGKQSNDRKTTLNVHDGWPAQRQGFPGDASSKEPACQCRRLKRRGFSLWVRKIPWRKAWQPIQYSCLENPMDRGDWQATVHGVSKGRTQLKQWARTHSGDSLYQVPVIPAPPTVRAQKNLEWNQEEPMLTKQMQLGRANSI